MTRYNLLVSLIFSLAVLPLVAGGSVISSTGEGGYYKESPEFHMYPDPNAPRYKIKRFGPVGLGLELRKPNFTIHIVNIEKGSPAEASGKFKKGQIIESVNGEVLKDIDPRVQLGNMITKAEANEGIMKIMVKDDLKSKPQEVVVKLPALGAYSETWPLNCQKSDKIVRTFADFLAENVDSVSVGLDASMLFMLSTGEEKDLEVVKKWIGKLVKKHKDADQVNSYPWFVGYSGPALCEYYLRTGDESILPLIGKYVDYLTRTIYNGSWMGRGSASYRYMGGGHMNAAGVHCLTFLLMAKECGVEVPEHTLQSCLLQFYRFAGRGSVAYGDGLPEGGTDNGRNTGLAFAMEAASNLTPEGENSVYAKARDISATKGFYSTSWLFHGHTGGGIGELWRGQSMGLISEKRPLQYRTFMDGRRWMYELARTHDGVFGWVSDWNVSYDNTAKEKSGAWGNWVPMIYTLPRKNLRLHGAPKSKYSKTYQLPNRPWGNETDDIFYSLQPGEYLPGKRQDLSKEILKTDASWPIIRRMNEPDVTDEVLLMYAHHIDVRSARAINNQGRVHLVVPLLKSTDPRGRLTGLTCIIGMSKGKPLPIEQVSDEMINLAASMVNDPKESWWVAHAAMKALGRARAELVAPHVDRLLYWLEHEDWWLRNAAITALTPVVNDERFYKGIMDRVGHSLKTDQRGKTSLRGLVSKLKEGSPAVQKYAIKVLVNAYQSFPKSLVEPGGQDLNGNMPILLGNIATALVGIPGGYDELYRIAPDRFPKEALPHKDVFFAADAGQFGPELKRAFVPLILEGMIPGYIEKNRKNLEREMKSGLPGRAIDGLVALYKKAGINDYSWKNFGPARDKIEWDYLTFEPEEKKLWEAGHRFRKVTPPKGSEAWYSLEFDPEKSGWRVGMAPFANLNGKLEPIGNCKATGEHTFCGCGEPPATFWDKEALLMRSEVELPKLKEGHAYRILVGGRSHYNTGGGSDIWLDGVLLKDGRNRSPTVQAGSGRNSWRPWGVGIKNEDRQHFDDGKVLIAANGFLRWGHRIEYIKCYRTIWFEEMKLPPIPPAKKTKD